VRLSDDRLVRPPSGSRLVTPVAKEKSSDDRLIRPRSKAGKVGCRLDTGLVVDAGAL
jgi:hypothetical protein